MPIKSASLIGNGPDIMKKISAVGNDMPPRQWNWYVWQTRPKSARWCRTAHHSR